MKRIGDFSRKSLSLLLSICLLWSISISFAIPVMAAGDDEGEALVNLVKNGGFEDDFDHWNKIQWQWNSTAQMPDNVSITSEKSHSGSKSVKIIDPPGAWVRKYCSDVIDVEENTEYTLSFWTCIPESDAIFVSVYNECSETISGDNVVYNEWSDSSLQATSGEWRHVEMTFNSGNNGGISICFEQSKVTTGEFYLDDFEIMVSAPEDTGGDGMQAGENLIYNPGFENGLEGWTFNGNVNSNLKLSTDTSHEGDNSLMIDGILNETRWESMIVLSPEIKVLPNTAYTLSYYSLSPIKTLCVDVVSHDKWGAFADALPMPDETGRWPDASAGFTKWSLSFNSGNNTSLHVRVMQAYNTWHDNPEDLVKDKFYLDDFEIKAVGGEPPVEYEPDVVDPGNDPGTDPEDYKVISPYIPNASFEDDLNGWTTAGSPTASTTKYSGTKALSLAGGSSVTSSTIGVASGKPYTLSFMGRVTGDITVSVNNGSDIASQTLSGSSDWTRYSIDVPASDTDLKINVSGTGSGYFDDFRLIQKKYINAYPRGDFEFTDGDLKPMSSSGARISQISDAENVYSGNSALQIRGKGSANIMLYPLRPSTKYYLVCYVKTDKAVALRASDFGFSAVTTDVEPTEGEYKRFLRSFTTGNEYTSVKISVENLEADSMTYLDNMELLYVPHEPVPVDDNLVSDSSRLPDITSSSDPNKQRNWQLSQTFTDEFSGSELNETRWIKKGKPGTQYEDDWLADYLWDPDNVSLSNDELVLTSYITPTGQKRPGKPDEFRTAAVITNEKTGYGFYEIKARTAPISLSSAFWFVDGDTFTEIDVFEQVGRAKPGTFGNEQGQWIAQNVHYWNTGYHSGKTTSISHTHKTTTDYTQDYHTYGFEWGPHYLRYYVDGVVVYEVENQYFLFPQNLSLDIEYFPTWGGKAVAADYEILPDGRNPAEFNIEYIRVWRADDEQLDERIMGNEVNDYKEALAYKATPGMTGNVLDPVWDSAQAIGALHKKSTNDSSTNAIVKTLWDEDYLYAMADVTDADVFTNPENPDYNNDSFEVYIGFGHQKNATYDPGNDFKVNIDADGKISAPELLAGCEGRAFLTDKGYIAQLAIPWQTIDPQIGTIIDFDIQINDASTATGGRISYKGWNDEADSVYQNMSYSGDLKLAGEPAPADPPVVKPPSGGSNGSSGSGRIDTNNATYSKPLPVDTSNAIELTKKAVEAAKTNGSGKAVVRMKNVSSIMLDTMKEMIKTAGGASIRVNADSMTADGGSVDVRIIFDPANATKGVNLSGATTPGQIGQTKAIFEKWFKNKIVVVHMEQQGGFGMQIEIAARLDLSGMDTQNLYFYSYDKVVNTYIRIKNPAYRIDANGYLHFTTELAGDVIVSSGPLMRR